MRRARRPVAVILLCCYLPACTSIKTSPLPPQEAIVGHDEIIVSVSRGAASETVRVRDPWIHNDTLGGTRRTCAARGHRVQCDAQQWWAPVADVREIRAREHDGTKTALLVGTSVAVVALTVVAYQAMMEDFFTHLGDAWTDPDALRR
jgi:hypothetical protein